MESEGSLPCLQDQDPANYEVLCNIS